MADQFQRPSYEDYDPEPLRRGPVQLWLSRITERVSGVLSALGSLLFVVLILVLWAADIRSCFHSASTTNAGQKPRPLRDNISSEVRVVTRLSSLWATSGGSADSLDVWMVDDESINAGSFGEGTFVLWTGLQSLTDDQLDAIFAHELAHDRLRHSRKSAELRDVTDFIGEAIGVFGHRDDATIQTLRKWSGDLVVPRYDRQQELDADTDAVKILSAGNYSEPAAMICRAFAHLRSVVGEAGGGFFDSHPALTERIQALRTRFPSRVTEMACR